MNLYYDRATDLFLLTRADAQVTFHPVIAWDLLNNIAGHCEDVTLNGRRFRVWTRDLPALNAFLRICNADPSPSSEMVEESIVELGYHGLHVEVLDGEPDELHGATAYVLIERSEYTGDYDDCIAQLALYAATAYDPDAAKAYVTKDMNR